jgi:hypothetical protein
MATSQQRPPFTDRPEVNEVFVDGIHSITSGGGVIRLSLTVVRSDGGSPQQLTNVLCSRLVFALPAAVELHQLIGRVLAGLQERGGNSAPATVEPKASE